MDPTVEFFAKLKKLSVTLESGTAKLQYAFENRNNDNDSETNARAMRAYHELNCDVGNLKGQIQEQLTEQKAQGNEVSSFIKACRVMEQRVTKDIQTLKGQWEKYGYEAPQDTQRSTSSRGQGLQADDEAADENKTESAEGGSQEEPGDNQPSLPPMAGPPPVTDVLRTPQLSDFGLSEMQLKRALAGADWCSEVPPMPEISLPHTSLNRPALPPMPITPKCVLRMDEEELQMPQMHDFGISEHTMCLLNDFTMDLLQKNVEKPSRPAQNIVPVPPVNSVADMLQAKDNLESPDPPVLYTPGFKFKKAKSHCSPPVQGDGDPESPAHPREASTTPEVPAFQTPYLKQLVSAKKSARQPEPINGQAGDDFHTLELPTPPCKESIGSKISFPDMENEQMPEMPNLESLLGNSLQNKSATMPNNISEGEDVTKEAIVNNQELEGSAQEFSLGTPHLRRDFQEPSTPEMPDLSSVTQDICKLLSQAQVTKTAHVRAEKDKSSPLPTAVSVSMVSESEFKSLPSYLRQMTLYNLNQAIRDINKFLAECQGEKTSYQMEELRRITNVGAKTPVYVLCLTELKRLTLVTGAKNDSVYNLCTGNN